MEGLESRAWPELPMGNVLKLGIRLRVTMGVCFPRGQHKWVRPQGQCSFRPTLRDFHNSRRLLGERGILLCGSVVPFVEVFERRPLGCL